MGILLLLGVVFGLAALSAKDEESAGKKPGAGSGEPTISNDQFEVRTAQDGTSYAALTGSGKALVHWALGQGFAINPAGGKAGEDGTLFLPLVKGGTYSANDYLKSLLTSADISIWIDVNMTGVVIAGGFDQPVFKYPLVLMTTGAEGWPPVGAYAESEVA